MADSRPNFAVLQDYVSGAGLPLHKVLENDASANKNALAALVGIDPLGNLRYLKTNSTGELIISLESEEFALLSDSGTHAGSASPVDIVTIPLQNSMTYKSLEVVCSCFRDAVFSVVLVDDQAETDLIPGIRSGAGEYQDPVSLQTLMFTTGATGTQELIVRGFNLNVTSTMDAVISVKEIQV